MDVHQSPIFVTDIFNRTYQVLGPGASIKPFACAKEKIFYDTESARRFVSRELDLSSPFLRSILADAQMINHQTTELDFDRLAIGLTTQKIRFFALPSIQDSPIIHDGKGKGYLFLPGPEVIHRAPMCVELNRPGDIHSLLQRVLADTGHWHKILNDLGTLTYRDKPDYLAEISKLLKSKKLRAYEFPYEPPRTKSGDFGGIEEPVRSVDIEIPPPPAAKKKVPTSLAKRKGVPPESLQDATQRLESMGKLIAIEGYQAKYTDDELLTQAQQGDVANERYHVRFMEKQHQWAYGSKDQSADNLTGALGREMEGASGTGPKYWSTTFDQIEDADTDPKLISEKLGLDYETDKEFVLIVVDTEKATPLTGVDSVAATFENVSEFSNRELPDEFPKSFTDQTMNDEFQSKYAEHYQDAVKSGALEHQWSTDTASFGKHLDSTTLCKKDKELMVQRMKMHGKVGNNQMYEGNGLTKNVIKNSDSKYGAVETLNFERKQTNLQQLKKADAISIIDIG